MKWNAWGYKDSGFFVNDNGIMEFAGRRYLIAGKELPRLQPLMEKYGLDTSLQSFSPVSCASVDLCVHMYMCAVLYAAASTTG